MQIFHIRKGMLSNCFGGNKVSIVSEWSDFWIQIETDHQWLMYFNRAKVTKAVIIRWAFVLQSYTYWVVAVKSKDNRVQTLSVDKDLCGILYRYELLVLGVRKCMIESISILLVKEDVLLYLRCCLYSSFIFGYHVLYLWFNYPLLHASIPVYMTLKILIFHWFYLTYIMLHDCNIKV